MDQFCNPLKLLTSKTLPLMQPLIKVFCNPLKLLLLNHLKQPIRIDII
nr:MAG TPA: hypothetical protein [Caudoviricetes sp.]